jgi:hypothetical protein
MTELKDETTLAKVRLHWGIFIPVVLFIGSARGMLVLWA